MRKKKSTAITVIGPREVESSAGKLATQQSFHEFDFWGQLKAKEQHNLVEESQQLSEAYAAHRKSALVMGKHLARLHEMLEPYTGGFEELCQSLRIHIRMGYRYKDSYLALSNILEEPFIDAMIRRGMSFVATTEKPLGKFTPALRALGTPVKNEKPDEWAADLEKTTTQLAKEKNKLRREGKLKSEPTTEEKVKKTPRQRMRRNVRNLVIDLKRVPAKERKEWFASVVGMALSHLKLGTMSFSPEPIPESWMRRGRPSLEDTEAA